MRKFPMILAAFMMLTTTAAFSIEEKPHYGQQVVEMKPKPVTTEQAVAAAQIAGALASLHAFNKAFPQAKAIGITVEVDGEQASAIFNENSVAWKALVDAVKEAGGDAEAKIRNHLEELGFRIEDKSKEEAPKK